MGRIYKRKDVWYIDVSVKGRRVRKRVGKSKRIAALALQDAEVKIARDEFGFSQQDITIERLIEKFLDYNKTNNRESTTRRYRAVADHLRAYLAEKRPDIVSLSQLTTEVIGGYKSYRRNAWVNPNGEPIKSDADIVSHTRKGARARTINLEVDGVKTMLNQAIKWGYIKENPLNWVKPLKEEDRDLVRFLSKEECSLFLANTPADLYPVFYTFLNTGMRKAELENLRWEDVDFARRVICIRRKENWRPKTGERDIPLAEGVYRQLSSVKANDAAATDSDYVFKASGSGHSHNRLRRELIKIARKAGISNLTKLHTLRHTYASHMIMHGIDLPTVKKLMGHSDIATTMIYAHLAPDHLSDAVNKVELV
jgi:integrase